MAAIGLKPVLPNFLIVNNSRPPVSRESMHLVMENHIKLTSGISANSYLRAFQVAQFNFYLFNEEEKMNKKRSRWRNLPSKKG